MDKGKLYVASRIDDAFLDIILQKLTSIVSYYNKSISETYRPEFTCVVELIYYMLSLTSSEDCGGSESSIMTHTTPGLAVFRLKFNFKPEHVNKKKLLMCLCILCKYLYSRFQLTSLIQKWRYLPDTNVRKKIWKLLQIVDIMHACGIFANSLSFCRYGIYPNILYRICGLETVNSVSQDTKHLTGGGKTAIRTPGLSEIEINYKSRALLWVAISSVLLAAKSINYMPTYRMVKNSSIWFLNYMKHSIGKINNDGVVSSNSKQSSVTLTKTGSLCLQCKRNPAEHIHMIDNCGHRFCYVCIYYSMFNANYQDFCDCLSHSHTDSNRDRRHQYQCAECHCEITSISKAF